MKDEKKVTIRIEDKPAEEQIRILNNIYDEVVKMYDALTRRMFSDLLFTNNGSPMPPFMPNPQFYNNGSNLFQSMQCPPPINPWADNQHKDSKLNPEEDEDEWDNDNYDNTLAEIEIGDIINVKHDEQTMECIVIGVNEYYIEVVSLNVLFISVMDKDRNKLGGFLESDLCAFLNGIFKDRFNDIKLSMYDDGIYVRVPSKNDFTNTPSKLNNPLHHIRNIIGIYIDNETGDEKIWTYWLEDVIKDVTNDHTIEFSGINKRCLTGYDRKDNNNGVRVKFRIVRNQ